MKIFEYWRMNYGLKWRGKFPPIPSPLLHILELILVIILVVLIYSFMQERDMLEMEQVVKVSQAREAKALKLLETCLNGKSLMLLDENNKPASAIFCDPSKEHRL